MWQDKSAAEYSIKFKWYSALTEWDDDALIVMYWRELKENVKNQLAFDDDVMKILNTLIKVAIEIDDKLYEHAMKKQHMIKKNWSNYYETQSVNIKSRQLREKWDASYYESQSMKLNLTQNRQLSLQRLWENSDKRKITMTCYSCDKLSHIAQNCCSKNKMSWQQLNILQWVQIITPSQSTLIRINEEIESLRQKLEDTKAQKETSEEWDSDESFTVNTEESQKKSDSDNLVFEDEENFETIWVISIEKLSEKGLKLTFNRTEIQVLDIDEVDSLLRANYYYDLRNLQHEMLCHIYCVDRMCKDHYFNNESHCCIIQCK